MEHQQFKKRNGKIEFFRFIFCIIIILFHCNRILGDGGSKESWRLGLFPRGYIGVEFFYFVSGYLLANSLFLSREKNESRPFDREYWSFLWGKVLSILPYHLLAFAALFVQDWFFKKYTIGKAVKVFLSEIPGLFLLQKAGFNFYNLNSVEWYISAMLVAMAVIYVFCHKDFRNYSGVVAPLSAVLIIGWIFFNCGAMSGASRKMPLSLGYVCLFRAFAEINLGIFAFRIAKVLERESWGRRERIFLSVIEWGGYAASVLFSLFEIPIRFEIIPLFCLFVSVTLSFSRSSCYSSIWDRKPFYFLGRFSVTLYLNQLFAIYLVRRYAPGRPLVEQGMIVLCITAIVSLVFMAVGSAWLKRIKASHLHKMINS